jgi:plastocyanin
MSIATGALAVSLMTMLVMLNRLGGTTIAASTLVRMTDYVFEPAAVTINVGDTITWTNTTSPHTAIADNGHFASHMVDGANPYSLTFNMPGTYTLLVPRCWECGFSAPARVRRLKTRLRISWA